MSKIGKLPITLENNVQVAVTGSQVQVTGQKGSVNYTMPDAISAEVAEGKVTLTAKHQDDRKIRALFGLTRANLANIIKGQASGFEKKLELKGVGYRAQMQGAELVLSLGFSHPVKFKPLPGITIAVANNIITVSGADNVVVGETAAKIRAIRPPEPYKGKGIRYEGEYVRRKAGKAAKAAGAK